MVYSGMIVMVVLDVATPVALVTEMVTGAVLTAVVGVPEMTPPEEMLNPAGRPEAVKLGFGLPEALIV